VYFFTTKEAHVLLKCLKAGYIASRRKGPWLFYSVEKYPVVEYDYVSEIKTGTIVQNQLSGLLPHRFACLSAKRRRELYE
jgi:hypothetical protein